jgi:hypothetical protein
MQEPTPITSSFDGVPFAVRPEHFAGNDWWRVYVDGNPRVLLRYREYAQQVAEVLAADEAQFRRASRLGEVAAAPPATQRRAEAAAAEPDQRAGGRRRWRQGHEEA